MSPLLQLLDDIFHSAIVWTAFIALVNAILVTVVPPQYLNIVAAFNLFIAAIGTVVTGQEVIAKRKARAVAALKKAAAELQVSMSEALVAQLDRLTRFIRFNFADELTEDKGAVDTAIRLLRKYPQASKTPVSPPPLR